MPAALNPRWEAALEARGLKAVQALLASSPGAGAGAVVPGLGDAIEDMPHRGYAEEWVARKVVEQNTKQGWLAWPGAIAASVAALMSFLSRQNPIK